MSARDAASDIFVRLVSGHLAAAGRRVERSRRWVGTCGEGAAMDLLNAVAAIASAIEAVLGGKVADVFG